MYVNPMDFGYVNSGILILDTGMTATNARELFKKFGIEDKEEPVLLLWFSKNLLLNQNGN